ncbi:MAG: aa3-type cytochrome c oxidase subunit IV [Pseudomonadota bacterium]
MATSPEMHVQAHVRTYGSFLRMVLAAAAHVTILLSSLALAFLGDAPVFAAFLFLIGHGVLFAALFTRGRTLGRDSVVQLVEARR